MHNAVYGEFEVDASTEVTVNYHCKLPIFQRLGFVLTERNYYWAHSELVRTDDNLIKGTARSSPVFLYYVRNENNSDCGFF